MRAGAENKLAKPRRGAHKRSPLPTMPTYEYACPKCGQHFEKFQSMNDEPLKKCLKCGKSGVKRLVGKGAGLIFKGTGFYITDYKNQKGSGAAEGGGSKPGESKSEGAGSKAAGGAAESKAPSGTVGKESKPASSAGAGVPKAAAPKA